MIACCGGKAGKARATPAAPARFIDSEPFCQFNGATMYTQLLRSLIVTIVVGTGSVAFAANGSSPSLVQGESKTKCVAECVAKAAECVKKHAGHKVKEAECAEEGVKCERECK
jgi:hypothetical protein